MALLMACLGKHQPGIGEGECRAILDDPRTDLGAMVRIFARVLGIAEQPGLAAGLGATGAAGPGSESTGPMSSTAAG